MCIDKVFCFMDKVFCLFRGNDSDPPLMLKMDVGATYYPKKNPCKPKGEDAYFICSNQNVVGVADGVGGWSDKGIDGGQYARDLMQNALLSTLHQPKRCINPRTILNDAFRNTECEGSSTACIVALKPNPNKSSNKEYYSLLHAINIGDSGFMLFRNLKLIFQSPTQLHEFNTPYQLGNYKCDTPKKAKEFKVNVKADDIIVFGTDGLFDNVFPRDIQRYIELNCGGEKKVTPRDLSRVIADVALRNSKKRFTRTPFSQACRKARKEFYGGKVDDITVMVAYIVPC